MDRGTLRLAGRRPYADGTTRYFWTLADDRETETVYSGPGDRPELELSTQTGCPYCRSSREAVRNLTVEEIVGQAVRVDQDRARTWPGVPARHITFAGWGEPLLNYDNVMAAAARLYRCRTTDLVSVTTVGVVPGIDRLAADAVPVELQVSLHATEDETRGRLVPAAGRWRIAEVLGAARRFAMATERLVVINYLLCSGVNDTEEDVGRLIELLDPDLFEVRIVSREDTGGCGTRGAVPGRRGVASMN